ncbi:MAG: Mu-like prophage major head subunit gpT family protein [Verrucomicrobia bacterium]|nr:Mu-like prophage major head subunit gpT family protein [Verrucomicrobiota bacterium]
MLLSKQVIDEASEGFRLLFQQGLDSVKAMWQTAAMESPSTGDSETYGWLKSLPGMREWLGDRVVNNLAASDYNIKNRDYELTVSVPRNAFEDDKLGVFRAPFLGLGDSVGRSPDELVWPHLLAGFTTLCHDGKYMFATDHPNGKQTAWSNKGTKKISQTNFEAAYVAMSTLVNENGKPLAIKPTHLFHGPTDRSTVFAIVKSTKLDDLTDNPNLNLVEPVEIPWFAASRAWFLADLSRPYLKPIILQRRKAPQFVMKNSVTDDNVFFQKEFIYGADDRKAVGWSLPQLAYGSTGVDAA